MKESITGSTLGIYIFIPKNETLHNRASKVYRAFDIAGKMTLTYLVDSVKMSGEHVSVNPNPVYNVSTREALKASMSSSLRPVYTQTIMGSEMTWT